MLWLLFLGFTIVAWTVNDVFFKLLGNQMNYFLALFIIALSQLVVAIPFLVYAMSRGELDYSAKGFYISGLIGVSLALGTIFFFYTFKFGAPLSVAMSVYGIGSIIVGALAGVFIFKEVISPTVLVGMVLGAVSIILLTV
jgi:drug/metabolite transporter (DMT)-like permease